MFENSKEKKFFIATIFIMATSGVIYLFLINLKLAIAFLIFISICFLVFMVLNTAADKDLKVDDTPQDMTVSAEEEEIIQAELEEELRDEQAKKYMKEGLPRDPIDISGNPVTSKAQGVENGCPVDYTQTMVVPDKISLGTHDETQKEQLDLVEKMPSLPTHINVIGDTIIPQNVDLEIKSNPANVNVVSNTIPLDHPLSLVEIVREKVDTEMKSKPTHANVVSNIIPLDHPLSLLEIYTTTKSTDTGADIAATMRAPSTILI